MMAVDMVSICRLCTEVVQDDDDTFNLTVADDLCGRCSGELEQDLADLSEKYVAIAEEELARQNAPMVAEHLRAQRKARQARYRRKRVLHR
jgi:hypothetical protein